jgi:uncharacterized protein
MIEPKFVERIAVEVSARPEQVAAAIPLFDKGATVPFVARYRKDATGRLDEARLEKIEELNTHFIALTSRRNAILENIAKQGKLTDALRQQIEECLDQTVLEDLYLPFKKQRRSKATAAVEQGLEPLADFLWTQAPVTEPLEDFAEAFVKPERMISSPEEAMLGAYSILAERVAMDAAARGLIRERMTKDGRIVSAATKNAQGQKTKFEAFYEFSEPLASIRGQKLLALLRGVRLGYLRMDLVVDDAAVVEQLTAHYLKQPGSVFETHFRQVVEDAYKRLLRPAIENEVITEARRAAEEDAIQVFRQSAETLLLAPGAGPSALLGLMPAGQAPWGVAAIGADGAFLEGAAICPLAPQNDVEGAEKTLGEMITRHGVQGIVIGEADGARDAARFVGTTLKKLGHRRVFWVLLDPSHANQCAVSKHVRQELPEADLPLRAASSLARYLQDPLAELIKLEPRALASGQYQHDVNQRRLREAMCRTVESCVNRVGANLNTASVELLRYVSGIQMGTAQNIVEHRAKNGGFATKSQLLEVPGIGEKTYEQCAGFLRIPGAVNPLDGTRIHPEAYPVVEQMAQEAGVDLDGLLGNEDRIGKVDLKALVRENIGELALADIRAELLRPGHDPRVRFRPPHYVDGAYDVSELQEGAEAEGTITSITEFGVFVDIGVGQDGLVHLSELANHFIREPRGLFKIGDIMRVKVIKVDREAKRISLSRKALLQAPRPRPQAGQARGEQPPAEAPEKSATEHPAGERPPGRAPRHEGEPRERRRPDAAARDGRRTDRNDRKREKPGRRPSGDRPHPPAKTSFGDSGDLMNTQLADQLAELRKKFGS